MLNNLWVDKALLKHGCNKGDVCVKVLLHLFGLEWKPKFRAIKDFVLSGVEETACKAYAKSVVATVGNSLHNEGH